MTDESYVEMLVELCAERDQLRNMVLKSDGVCSELYQINAAYAAEIVQLRARVTELEGERDQIKDKHRKFLEQQKKTVPWLYANVEAIQAIIEGRAAVVPLTPDFTEYGELHNVIYGAASDAAFSVSMDGSYDRGFTETLQKLWSVILRDRLDKPVR